MNFTISGQTDFITSRRYLVIADVASGATVGHTFTASIPNANDVTTTGAESGTATGNEQTIADAACTSPNVSFALTGGGSYCAGGAGMPVGLSGSENGVTYELHRDGLGTGQTVAGTGSSISFGNQAVAGAYTVWSTSAGGYCVEQMAGNPSSVSVSINALPAITLGSGPAVGQGTTTASLSYSAATGSPDQYSLDFDSAAEAQNFTDLPLASLPSSPITIIVPGNAAVGTYNAVLTVKNSSTGCAGAPVPLTVTITDNHAPQAQDIPLGAQSGIKQTLQIINNPKYAPYDADGDTLILSAVNYTSGNGATVTVNGTDVEYTAPGTFTGSDSYSYTVSDGRGGTATGTVTVTVSAVVNQRTAQLSFDVGGNVWMIFWGLPGEIYTIQRATDVNGPWSDLSPTVTASTSQPYGRITFTDGSNPPFSGYYRLKP